MEKESLIGTKIIGIINLSLLGVFTTLIGLAALFCYFAKNYLYQQMVAEISNPMIILFFGIAFFIFGLFYIATGHGLLMLNNTARKATIYFILFYILLMIILNVKQLNNLKYLVRNPLVIYDLITMFYLTRPNVKEQFK